MIRRLERPTRNSDSWWNTPGTREFFQMGRSGKYGKEGRIPPASDGERQTRAA